jgi:DNA repair protein RadC
MKNINLYTLDTTTNDYRPATADEILAAARRELIGRVRKGTIFTSPKVTSEYLIARLGHLPHEVFTLIYVDLCGAAVYAETLHYSAALA